MHDIGPTPASSLNDQCPLDSGFYVLRVCACVWSRVSVLAPERAARGGRACVLRAVRAAGDLREMSLQLYNWV